MAFPFDPWSTFNPEYNGTATVDQTQPSNHNKRLARNEDSLKDIGAGVYEQYPETNHYQDESPLSLSRDDMYTPRTTPDSTMPWIALFPHFQHYSHGTQPQRPRELTSHTQRDDANYGMNEHKQTPSNFSSPSLGHIGGFSPVNGARQPLPFNPGTNHLDLLREQNYVPSSRSWSPWPAISTPPAPTESHMQVGGSPYSSKLPIRQLSSSSGSSPTSSSSYKCHLCDRTFTRLEGLKRHHADIHGPPRYVCKSCDYQYARLDKIKMHCRKEHGQALGCEDFTDLLEFVNLYEFEE